MHIFFFWSLYSKKVIPKNKTQLWKKANLSGLDIKENTEVLSVCNIFWCLWCSNDLIHLYRRANSNPVLDPISKPTGFKLLWNMLLLTFHRERLEKLEAYNFKKLVIYITITKIYEYNSTLEKSDADVNKKIKN